MKSSAPYFETAPLRVYALWSIIVGMLACWPVFVTGSVFVFFDIKAYLSNGAAILQVISGAIETSSDETAGAALGETTADRGRSIRSMLYSAYVFFGSLTPLGPGLPVVVQSILVSCVALLLVPRAVVQRPIWAAVALITLLLLTPWPFYASLFMPDFLVAAVILGAMVLVRGTNGRGYVVVGALSAFAAASHYGNLPLVFGLFVVIGVWQMIKGRMSWLLGATLTLPLIFAVLVNILGGLIAFGETSVAPRRLPILLARSLADGPARWHLEESCDLYDYAICTALEEFPDSVGGALWQDGGLAGISSVVVLNQIRAEEPILLWRAFLDYPGAQSWSLMRNVALQMTRFGLSDVYFGKVAISADGTFVLALDQERHRGTFDKLEVVHMLFVLLSLAVLLSVVARRQVNMVGLGAMTVILFAGLLLNAAIFGGLSAPVDRYQGRIIWCLPLLAALALLARKPEGERD